MPNGNIDGRVTDGNGWEGDLATSEASYREIVKIPGLSLRKPLEVALYKETGRPQGVVYRVTYILPSLDKDGMGHKLDGVGATEEEASNALIELLVGLYTDLKRCKKKELGPEPKLQKAYLESIMVPNR